MTRIEVLIVFFDSLPPQTRCITRWYEKIRLFWRDRTAMRSSLSIACQCKTSCIVWLIPGEDFLKWLRESPDFSLLLMKSLCKKLLSSSDRLTRLSLLTMRQRYLLSVYTLWAGGAAEPLEQGAAGVAVYWYWNGVVVGEIEKRQTRTFLM